MAFAVDNIILTVRENWRVDVLLQVGAMTNTVAATSTSRSPTTGPTAPSRAPSRATRASLTIDRNAKFDSANTRECQLQFRAEW